tara:strand:+ start:270 stop:398 length:129 start_codon:yes stop_codon:yes gene_type:complete
MVDQDVAMERIQETADMPQVICIDTAQKSYEKGLQLMEEKKY